MGQIPIFVVGGRGLIFSIDDLRTLREEHNVCGTLTGILPSIPQQNVFMGLPLELMPEDVEYLVSHNICYAVRDREAHDDAYDNLTQQDRELTERIKQDARTKEAEEYKETAWAKRQVALAARAKKQGLEFMPESDETKQQVLSKIRTEDNFSHIIDATTSMRPYHPENFGGADYQKPDTAAYAMYKYLHEKGYFLSPGLRFGGQFLAYPGDPLRFHSHYTATGFGYDEQFKVLDIVSSGRLGTAVKKCWVIGGENNDTDDSYSSYSIEWAGFG